MTRGINTHERGMKKQKIVDFISKYQPCSRNFILKNGHFRRNTLWSYLKELGNENKIINRDGKYFLCPLSKTLLIQQNVREDAIEKLQFLREVFSNITRQIRIMDERAKKEPMRFRLTEQKIMQNSDIIGKFSLNSSFLEFKEEKLFKVMSIEEKLSHILRKLPYANPFIVYQLFLEFDRHFKLYPRFEFKRFKNSFKGSDYNPHGIDPKFLKKDGSVDFERVEEIYSNRLLLGSCIMECKNGHKAVVEMSESIAYQLALRKKLKEIKISTEQFEQNSKWFLYSHPPRILSDIPKNSNIKKIPSFKIFQSRLTSRTKTN